MSSYLIPVLLVCIIGIVAGVILTIAAKLMFVPVDERVSACTDALPGANCGGCGYAGCSDYAVAIVENGAELNKCPVGGAAVAEALGAVMGVSVEAGEAHYALVKCGGYADKSQKILEYKGIPSCKALAEESGNSCAAAAGAACSSKAAEAAPKEPVAEKAAPAAPQEGGDK